MNMLTDAQKQQLYTEYLNPLISRKDLFTKYKISQSYFYKWLNQSGLQKRGKGAGDGLNRKYTCDFNFFEIIDTEEKAYWLGFLYADGNIQNKGGAIRLVLSAKDASHIEKFKKSINANYPTRRDIVKAKTYKGHYIKEAETAALLLCNSKMRNDLVNKGCLPKKSLILEFPSHYQVPEQLMRHFLRGYFDGDGTICSSGQKLNVPRFRLDFIGTEKFINSAQNYIHSATGHETKIKKHHSYWLITYGGVFITNKIADLLYKDATIFLDRKYEKYLVMKQTGLPT